MSGMDLAGFLRARFTDDERRADQFEQRDPVPFQWAIVEGLGFPPKRVRADCDVKRRIVAEHATTRSDPNDPHMLPGYCRMCVGEAGWPVRKGRVGLGVLAPCRTLRLLASPYADHADYQREWKP